MANLNKNENHKATINVVNGVGNDAIQFDYTEGDTVANILDKAKISLSSGSTVTLGRKNITDPDNTPVKPGDTLVIASKVSNG